MGECKIARHRVTQAVKHVKGPSSQSKAGVHVSMYFRYLVRVFGPLTNHLGIIGVEIYAAGPGRTPESPAKC